MRLPKNLWLWFIVTVIVTNILLTSIMLYYKENKQSSNTFPVLREEIHIKKTTYLPKTECSKRTNVAFLKVHKAGSTTLMTMFLRFADYHGLNIVLPRPMNYLGFDTSINIRNVYPPPPNENYNILCNHVVYNKTVFYNFMPHDTTFIAIVRDPVTHVISAAEFFHAYDDMRNVLGKKSEQQLMSEFLKNPNVLDAEQQKFLKTRMSLDFGIPREDLNSTDKVLKHLNTLDLDFKLVMVMERFDESLILLKRILCWELKDVIYVPLNERHVKAKVVIEGEDLKNLKIYNHADFILYPFFKSKFVEKVNAEGNDFNDEVSHYKQILPIIGRFCKDDRKINKRLVIGATRWSKEFSISNEECDFITKHEYSLVYDLVMKYKRRLQNSS